jgi:hypothetical protein
VIEEFMPDRLSEEELESIIDDAIAECGATSMRDLGRVMADVMPQVAGRADGSAVSQLVARSSPERFSAGALLVRYPQPPPRFDRTEENAHVSVPKQCRTTAVR